MDGYKRIPAASASLSEALALGRAFWQLTKPRVVALLVVPSPSAALDLLALCGERAAGMVSAFELIGKMGFDFLAETMRFVFGHDFEHT
mgnify:CR=1 FL=1